MNSASMCARARAVAERGHRPGCQESAAARGRREESEGRRQVGGRWGGRAGGGATAVDGSDPPGSGRGDVGPVGRELEGRVGADGVHHLWSADPRLRPTCPSPGVGDGVDPLARHRLGQPARIVPHAARVPPEEASRTPAGRGISQPSTVCAPARAREGGCEAVVRGGRRGAPALWKAGPALHHATDAQRPQHLTAGGGGVGAAPLVGWHGWARCRGCA